MSKYKYVEKGVDSDADYWEGVDNVTLNGVLGGFAHLDTDDVIESKSFVKSLKLQNFDRSIDCGGGIGRVAKHLLIPMFKKVDLVEPTRNLIEAAPKFVDSDKLDKLYMTGLENFVFEYKYDLVWVQWCIGHLTDDDMVQFLQNCKKGLTKDGFIVFKENIAQYTFIFDTEDSSITRTEKHFHWIFDQAGFNVVSEQFQQKFPKELFQVKMFALQPK